MEKTYMATTTAVSKMRVASRVCKLSAWIIAAVGIVAAGIYVSTLVPVIPLFRQSQAQSPYIYITLTSVISALFLIIVPTLFFTVVLYALGTFMDYMSGETKSSKMERSEVDEEEVDDEPIQIVPIPEMR